MPSLCVVEMCCVSSVREWNDLKQCGQTLPCSLSDRGGRGGGDDGCLPAAVRKGPCNARAAPPVAATTPSIARFPGPTAAGASVAPVMVVGSPHASNPAAPSRRGRIGGSCGGPSEAPPPRPPGGGSRPPPPGGCRGGGNGGEGGRKSASAEGWGGGGGCGGGGGGGALACPLPSLAARPLDMGGSSERSGGSRPAGTMLATPPGGDAPSGPRPRPGPKPVAPPPSPPPPPPLATPTPGVARAGTPGGKSRGKPPRLTIPPEERLLTPALPPLPLPLPLPPTAGATPADVPLPAPPPALVSTLAADSPSPSFVDGSWSARAGSRTSVKGVTGEPASASRTGAPVGGAGGSHSRAGG